MESTIDLDLRERRIAAYADLWRATAILPRWPRSHQVTYNDLKKFSATMRDWYFNVGGMYLSERSVKAYNGLQDSIWLVLGAVGQDGMEKMLQGSAARDMRGHYDSIRQRCSALRQSLASDVVSRRPGPTAPVDGVADEDQMAVDQESPAQVSSHGVPRVEIESPSRSAPAAR